VETITANPPVPGWVYVLTHPAWEKLGMVKIGRTGRDPRTRAAEITSVSGLLAPCKIAWCSPVSDMAAAEKAVHRMLDAKRVRKGRELFRVDTATAQQTVQAVAQSLPSSSGSPYAASARSLRVRPGENKRPSYRFQARRYASPWRYSRRRPLMLGRLMIGLVTLAALIGLLNLN
jgi:hypothetical protein